MKAFIREEKYETNSSSSHAVCIAKDDIFDRSFDQIALRNKLIVLQKRTDNYDAYYRFTRPETILTFLIASEIDEADSREFSEKLDIGRIRYEDVDILPKIMECHPPVAEGIAFLKDYTGADFKFLITPADTGDWETSGLWNHVNILNNPAKLKRLLFNSKSFVQIEEENGWAGKKIESDDGLIANNLVNYDLDEYLDS